MGVIGLKGAPEQEVQRGVARGQFDEGHPVNWLVELGVSPGGIAVRLSMMRTKPRVLDRAAGCHPPRQARRPPLPGGSVRMASVGEAPRTRCLHFLSNPCRYFR